MVNLLCFLFFLFIDHKEFNSCFGGELFIYECFATNICCSALGPDCFCFEEECIAGDDLPAKFDFIEREEDGDSSGVFEDMA